MLHGPTNLRTSCARLHRQLKSANTAFRVKTTTEQPVAASAATGCEKLFRSGVWVCTNVIFLEYLELRDMPNLIDSGLSNKLCADTRLPLRASQRRHELHSFTRSPQASHRASTGSRTPTGPLRGSQGKFHDCTEPPRAPLPHKASMSSNCFLKDCTRLP